MYIMQVYGGDGEFGFERFVEYDLQPDEVLGLPVLDRSRNKYKTALFDLKSFKDNVAIYQARSGRTKVGNRPKFYED